MRDQIKSIIDKTANGKWIKVFIKGTPANQYNPSGNINLYYLLPDRIISVSSYFTNLYINGCPVVLTPDEQYEFKKMLEQNALCFAESYLDNKVRFKKWYQFWIRGDDVWEKIDPAAYKRKNIEPLKGTPEEE